PVRDRTARCSARTRAQQAVDHDVCMTHRVARGVTLQYGDRMIMAEDIVGRMGAGSDECDVASPGGERPECDECIATVVARTGDSDDATLRTERMDELRGRAACVLHEHTARHADAFACVGIDRGRLRGGRQSNAVTTIDFMAVTVRASTHFATCCQSAM